MKVFRRFYRYINPVIDPEVQHHMDRYSMRSIYYASIAVFVVETLLFLYALLTNLGSMNQSVISSLISIGSCVVMCFVASLLSSWSLRKKNLSHKAFVAIRILFFIAFMAWAIDVDFRHYRQETQMLTFFTVSLMMICFVHFRPWIGSLLIAGAHLVFYLAIKSFDGAANLEPLNFLVLAVVSALANTILFHNQIFLFSRQDALYDRNQALREENRTDALTGIWNRLGLERDAQKMDGRPMTAYMIDINYFKEINDRYGHLAGDELLRETTEQLKQIFPGAHYYRYGGDEFLVLTHKPACDNYGSSTYDFTDSKYGVRASLSIGSAQSAPANYDELFHLISQADKALYVVKRRTHSVEFGGHDRRAQERK